MISALLFLTCIQIDRIVDGFGNISNIKINNDYLYILNSESIWIFDVKDKENPISYKQIELLGQGLEFEIWGDLFFLSIYGKGVYCFNKNSIEKFVPLSIIEDLPNVIGITFQYPHLFLTDPDKGFYIFDYSNPYEPKFISSIGVPYLGSIKVQNGFAYIYSYGSPGIVIFDIQNLYKPILLSLVMPVFLNDFDLENGILYGIEGHNIYMCDITDPKNPVDMGYLFFKEIGSGQRIDIVYPYAIVLDYHNFLFYSIEDPWNPIFYGYSTPIEQNNNFVLLNNYIFVVGSNGFEVLKFDNFHSPLPISFFSTSPNEDIEVQKKKDLLFRFYRPNFEVWDVSNVINPFMIISLKDINWETFALVDNFVYFSTYNKIEIWDFADPYFPSKISEFYTYSYPAKKIFVKEKFLIYVCSDYFIIYDISNPIEPIEISFNYNSIYPYLIAFKPPYLAMGYQSLLKIWDLSDLSSPEVVFEKKFNFSLESMEFYDEDRILFIYEKKLSLYDFKDDIILNEYDLNYGRNIYVNQGYIFLDTYVGTSIFELQENKLKIISFYPDKGPVCGLYPYFIFKKSIGNFTDLYSPYTIGRYMRSKGYSDVINDGESFYILAEDGMYWWRPNFYEPKKIFNYPYSDGYRYFLSAEKGKIFFVCNYSLYLLDNRNPLDPRFYKFNIFNDIVYLNFISDNYAFAVDIIYTGPYEYYFELNLADFSNFEEVNFQFLENYYSHSLYIDKSEDLLVIGDCDSIDIWKIKDPSNPFKINTMEFDKTIKDLKFLNEYLAILFFSGKISIYDLKDPLEPCILSSIENLNPYYKIFSMPFVLGMYGESKIEFWSVKDIRNPYFLDFLEFKPYQKIAKIFPFGLRFGLFTYPQQLSIWDLCNCLDLNIKCLPYTEPEEQERSER